jgi:hypothetical protein
MNRWILALLILLVGAAFLPAVDFATFEGSFQLFADAVADNLASTATSGLAWSPAYIGEFPHFGLGLTVGASLIPYEVVKPVLDILPITLPAEFDYLQPYGVPLPAATIDARIGGSGVPFDIGLKIGFIPDPVKARMGDLQADYFIAGGDLRIAILKDSGSTPALSVGAGYSYLKGGVRIAGLMGGSTRIDITDLMVAYGKPAGPVYELEFSDPALAFTWESHVVEAKAQISKNLLIFTPHLGIGAAYAIKSVVGGGLFSSVAYLEGGTPGNLQDAKDAFTAAGETPPTDLGITVAADAPAGWAFRVFGGTSINLSVLRLDLDANWNVLTNAYGGNVNFRFEL